MRASNRPARKSAVVSNPWILLSRGEICGSFARSKARYSRAMSLRCNSSTTNRHLSFSAMTSQYFIVGTMPNLESFDGFSVQLLENQLCALGLSDG